jgi:acylphosphatase
MNERLEAIVSGRVQKVMYRDFACRKARRLGLTGTVTNYHDGTVHVRAEGSRERLETYLVLLHKGSLLSHVTGVSVSWLPATGAFTKFKITHEY